MKIREKNRYDYHYRGRRPQRFFYAHPELWGLLTALAVAALAVVIAFANG